jgi:PucR family transcriptional regulator, proline-responsive transcriptional activator
MVKIGIAVLLDYLEPYKPLCNVNKDEQLCISMLGFFDKKTPPVEKELLFIGYASDLPANISVEHSIILICITNCNIPKAYFENPSIHLITLDSGAELIAVYNAVDSLFRDERRMKLATSKLFQSVIHDFSLQQMCDIGYELLGNPIVIVDNSLKNIAWTSNIEVDDPLWIEFNKTGGYLSNESLLLLTTQSEFKQDLNQSSPFIMSKGQLKHRRMINHIFVDQKVIGTMIVVESEKPFRETDSPIVGMIAKVLALEMKKNSFILYSKALAEEHFFKDLLDGMHDKGLVSEKLKTQHLVIKDNLYLLTIDISEFDRTYKTLQYFRELLDKMIFDCKSILYNDYIVIIIMHDNDIALSEAELERLTAFFKENNLYGGISRCFHDILDIRVHFDQAVTAAALSRRLKNENRLSFYKDVSVYHLLDLAAQKIDLKQLCHESLVKLIEYDRRNNTSYTQNLYQYLIHERNLAHTTLALHVHRNTLVYRINKIIEIIQVDLEDSDVRFQLLLTYKILDLLYH